MEHKFDGIGYVYSRETPEDRREEIDKLSNDAWYPVLVRLNEDIESIDPGYSLDQLKSKFGGLRYYITPTVDYDSEDGIKIRSLIRQAEKDCDTISRERLNNE